MKGIPILFYTDCYAAKTTEAPMTDHGNSSGKSK